MKKKIISVVAIIMTALLFCACFNENYKPKEETKSTESITITPPCTTGTIKVYSNINGVLFDGYGEFKIKNSGWNGRPIEIEMYINENNEIGE